MRRRKPIASRVPLRDGNNCGNGCAGPLATASVVGNLNWERRTGKFGRLGQVSDIRSGQKQTYAAQQGMCVKGQ
jgi:hypothetical protein